LIATLIVDYNIIDQKITGHKTTD